MEAYTPDSSDWRKLLNKVGPLQSSDSANIDNEGRAAHFLGEKKLRQRVEQQNFKGLGTVDLLLIIQHSIWDQLPDDLANKAGTEFWKFCSQNVDPGFSVYFWFFNNPDSFHEFLQRISKNYKGHPKRFAQFFNKQYQPLAEALLSEKEGILHFAEREFVPINALIAKPAFQKALAAVFWPRFSTQAQYNLLEMLELCEPSSRRRIMANLCKAHIDFEKVSPLDKPLSESMCYLVNSEALSKTAYTRFARATNQINFEELRKRVNNTSSPQFIAYGFEDIPDKYSDQIIFKRWLSLQLRIAHLIQRHFKHAYMVTEGYYDKLFSGAEKTKYRLRCPAGSDSNFILLINSQARYVCIGLPKNKGDDINPGFWLGTLCDKSWTIQNLSNFQRIKQNSAWCDHTSHGTDWKVSFLDKLIKHELIEAKSVEVLLKEKR